mgnify:CR=1 FL=1
MSNIDFETLKELLKSNIIEVTFTKVNGEKRVMKCTLQESFLPEQKSESDRKKNENVLAVFDIDSNDWRSFRFDSVISYNIGGENVSQDTTGSEQDRGSTII